MIANSYFICYSQNFQKHRVNNNSRALGIDRVYSSSLFGIF